MKLKVLKIISLSCVLAMGITNMASAATPSTQKALTHLKVNQYYILYTAPKAPYIDTKQRLMVPLRSISELLGAEVTYNAKSKMANIVFSNHQLRLTSDSKAAYLNDMKITMDTVPVIYENSMIIPLKIILDAFQIKANLNSAYGYINIQDSRLLKTRMFSNFEEFDSSMNSLVDDEEAFVPLQTKITTTAGKSDQAVQVTITAQNITEKSIPTGREDLHPVFLTKGKYLLDSDGAWPDSKARIRPSVKKDEKIQRSWDFSVQNNDPLLYILVKGRTFSQSINN
ncbi:copper amine oxidase N-terminal domain-containing protein [Paenibacillus wynnii]|uniref:Copper amine oxidase-like N-terminal domain-containing protein n=1 Tax=Paenibacillus wynnii TaxID=268407 RepID=A0A098MH71_9BACL|nr:copper amine oxidase N-terminal domain-containing protein [Paenibacillus wynnii]KGE20907.1 hypothetical protein PWYN_01640 [Paenibacillus wynnii]